MNKNERKPLSRITFTGLVLLFVIFAVIISFAVTKNKHPAVAEVLSSEPI
ncbi:UmoD, partial [Salmonella enterica subsp. enterica serovar Newport]|nr:UmoD [Salmonella enterica subsp. enterica serovar Newport]